MNKIILELKVRNHPGVMSHICGLFARRGYNMEGILCLPMSDNTYSRIWILVNNDDRLSQVIKQTNKLEDVITIKNHICIDHQIFINLEKMFCT